MSHKNVWTSFNPADNTLIGEGKMTSQTQINNIIKNAAAAFEVWKETPLNERTQILKQFQTKLKSETQNMATLISQEMGKPLWESQQEVQAMVNKVDISIKAYHERCQTIEIESKNKQLKTQYHPHGVLAVLGPFNFPGHLPNGHIIPALLAGNCIVFKPSEYTPLVGEAYCKLWDSLLPKGVLNIVQGDGALGEYLVQHPMVNGILFTGSKKVGQHIATQVSSSTNKILALEMGGNNPIILSKVSKPELAALYILQSAFITTGQRCSCARRLIINTSHPFEKTLYHLVKLSENLKIGRYQDNPFMGPLIHCDALENVLDTQDRWIKKGGEILLKSRHIQHNFVSPGILNTSALETEDKECFGPLLQIKEVGSFEEAIQSANTTEYGLSASILTEDPNEYQLGLRKIKAGIINWNQPTTGASSQLPFGGIKNSGNHRPSAYLAADYCSYPIASIESKTLEEPETMPPGIHYEGGHNEI